MSNPDDFLFGGGGKSAFGKDDPVGTIITGTIAETPVVQAQTDIKDGTPLTWDNGDVKEQLVVTLQTATRDDDDDDGLRKLYVKGSKKAGSKSMHDAIREAVKTSGTKGLAVGGTLTVQFIGTEPSSTRGYSDRKLFAAKYEAPVVALADGFIDVPQSPGPAAPVAPAAPAAQVAPAAPAAPVATSAPDPAQDVETVKALVASGLDDAAISTAIEGRLPMGVIAALRNAVEQAA